MSVLYNKINDLCNKRGITGYRLCKDIGMSPNVMTELKMGRRDGLSAKNINKVAEYFNVSVGYLLGTETEKSPAPEGAELSEARMKLLAAVDGLSEDEVLAMVQVAEAAKKMMGDKM